MEKMLRVKVTYKNGEVSFLKLLSLRELEHFENIAAFEVLH